MRRLCTLLTAGALVLAACGAGDGTEATETTPNDAGAVAPATTTTIQPEELTLADYIPMFAGPENEAEAQEYWRNQELVIQESVRDCMAEEGFEYIPYVQSYDDFYFEDWEMEEGERRAEQGFGMAFWVLREEEFEEPFGDEWDPSDDPNYAITEAMSEAEQEAYYYTLHGEQPDMDLDWDAAQTEEEMMALEEEANRLWMEREWKGCYEISSQDVYGGEDLWMSFDQEFDMWEEIEQRVEADPRIIALEQSWVSCMADAGYEYRDEQEMHESLWQEFEQIVTYPGEEGSTTGITTAPPDVEPVEQEDGTVIFVDPGGNEYTEEAMQEIWSEAWRPQYDETELRAFMEREIAIAVAEWPCSEGRWETQGEIYEEYQNLWVADNKAALDAWKAGLEAGG